MLILAGCAGIQTRLSPTRAGQHTDGNRPEYVFPSLPAVKLMQIVRPHEPDKPHTGVGCFECVNGLGRVCGSDLSFEITDDHTWIAHDILRPCHARVEGGWTTCLKRISRRDQPDHPIQRKPTQRNAREMDMSFMCRIERPAKKAHAHAGPKVEPVVRQDYCDQSGGRFSRNAAIPSSVSR